MDIQTEVIELSITSEAADMLRAFTKARNGSLHNVADAAIRGGILAMLKDAPVSFHDAYFAALPNPPPFRSRAV